MSIREKILYSFLVVIALLLVSVVSIFFFHSTSLEEYKEVSDNLILENTLTGLTEEFIEATNAVVIAPTSVERLEMYAIEREKIVDIFTMLDRAIGNRDSHTAYEGLKRTVFRVVADADAAVEDAKAGNVSDSMMHYNDIVHKKNFILENTTTLILTEIEHLNEIQSSVEKRYREQLLVVMLWVTAIVFSTTLYAVIFARRITTPVKMLSGIAKTVSGGDYTQRIPGELMSRVDEVGSLAHSFDGMLEALNIKIAQVETANRAVLETKKRVEERNVELERSQLATVNLLEDLEEEKHAVEQKVKDRTADIEREKNKLLQVTENMKGGGILLDANLSVVFMNEMARTVLGVGATEMESKKILRALYEVFAQGDMKALLKRCVRGETFRVGEVEGGGRLYEIFFHHLQNNQGDTHELIGYFILFFDITDAKLLERSKSELVAVASHQLRTPLTAMRGNVEMLIDESYGVLNKEQHELLDDVEVSTIRLITMVNDMLDITKIEKGDLEMTLESLEVKEIIDGVVHDLSTYAKRHEFEIVTKNVDAKARIVGDKIRVRQVFQNLIDNAIKYSSHPGMLEITTGKSGSQITITFKDNGIGIPKNEHSKLFDRFYRASNTSKTASSGSGLGLYIVKSIVNQLGGSITLESEENIGTTFVVSLPAKIT